MRALRGQASMGERVTFGCLLTVHADLYNLEQKIIISKMLTLGNYRLQVISDWLYKHA